MCPTSPYVQSAQCHTNKLMCVTTSMCFVLEPEWQCVAAIMRNSVFVFYTQIIFVVCQIVWWWRVCVSETRISEHPDCLLHYEWAYHACCLPIHTIGDFCAWGHLRHPAVTLPLGSVLLRLHTEQMQVCREVCVLAFLWKVQLISPPCLTYIHQHTSLIALELRISLKQYLLLAQRSSIWGMSALCDLPISFSDLPQRAHFHPNPWNGDSLARWHAKCGPNINARGTSVVSSVPILTVSEGVCFMCPFPP